MKTPLLKISAAVVAACLLSTGAEAAVTISQDVSYDFLSPVSSLAALTAGQSLVTDFGTSPAGSTAVFSLASGYGFSWVTDNTVPGSPQASTVFNSGSGVTGVYSNTTLISGISAPPPGDTPDYFTVVGPHGQATLTSANALTSFTLLWGSMDDYNSILFEKADGTLVQSFTGNDTTVLAGNGNGDQSSYVTNRWVRFNADAADGVTKIVFTSTSNSFEFDNLYASAVPEPATWLMMIAGFGLAGAGLRRRQGLLTA
jgi:hypothetical protein